jgi:U4/U6.U5 tri-snRNP-associated protein 3
MGSEAGDDDDEQLAMMRAMGIPIGFDSTKGKHVDDERCHVSGITKKNKREARQFMNRLKGGLIKGDSVK